MFNALAARCVWHCGVLLRLLLAAPLLVLACGTTCGLLSVVAMRCAAAKQLAARGFLAARARTRVQEGFHTMK